MDRLVEKRLVDVLERQVRQHRLPNGRYTDEQIYRFEDEQQFILNQFKELQDEDAWWSDPEWDWFLNRILDFMESTSPP